MRDSVGFIKHRGAQTFTVFLIAISLVGLWGVAGAETILPSEFSAKTKACIDCHKKETLATVEQWGSSRHYRAKVGC
ncbi:MAG: hypothetical protein QGG64_27135, partial [Candidatus Latescibacteria bacterium]|nr:hypothetical protein [Candidatus Latescibacterota bacterium]